MTPSAQHKRLFLTQWSPPTQPSPSQRTYPNVTSETLISPTQISATTETVASKTRIEQNLLNGKIQKSNKETKHTVNACYNMKNEIRSAIDTAKTDLQTIFKEAKDNITQHKSTHAAALEKLKAQEVPNKEFASVLSGYNQQFKDLGQRQRNIENQLFL